MMFRAASKKSGLCRVIKNLCLSSVIAVTVLPPAAGAATALAPAASTSVGNVTTAPLSVLLQRDLEARAQAAKDKGGKPPALSPPRGVKAIPRHDRPPPIQQRPAGPDPFVQKKKTLNRPELGLTAMPATGQNFEGQYNIYDVLPPDTNGDVGPHHYVQMVNISISVYDKTGTKLLGPVASNVLWQTLGGLCASNNDGDPVVLYDQNADRWLISQFALGFPNDFHECVAISQTGDPTGAWHLYDFLASTADMNDYPKLGIWPDGYYMSANDFSGANKQWSGASVYAFERNKMLQGLPAQMVKFKIPTTTNIYGLLPADWDGATPPPGGSPNPFVFLRSTQQGDTTTGLEIWNFHVDWTTPVNSTFNFVVNLPSPFDEDMCGWARTCIPQPGGSSLDAISDRLMFRNQYRNFGSHQAMVLNHTVDSTGTDVAGVRWYELTKSLSRN